MHFLGIDPGVSGGMAFLTASGQVLAATKMLPTEHDQANWLSDRLLEYEDQTRAMIEFVRATPQMGVVSAFTFGRSLGFLRGLLVAMNIPFDDVSPQRWQKAMGCLTHGDKNVSKAKAQQLFPHERVTHATADALLLAEYCRRAWYRIENALTAIP